ncbi:flavodoxin family protein [Candidatus Peregrinibacteria bacterium]|nr:flavodoxin family protein [Candidatus Peregrinibacteria bacterium]
MSTIKIVYGSGGGNTELVCEKVAEVLEQKKHKVKLLKAKLTEPKDVGSFDLLILASPTYGHGLYERFFAGFMAKAESELDVAGKKCATIGLGDMIYDPDYHVESGKMIQQFLKRKGALMPIIPLFVTKSPVPHLEGRIQSWAESVDKILSDQLQPVNAGASCGDAE